MKNRNDACAKSICSLKEFFYKSVPFSLGLLLPVFLFGQQDHFFTLSNLKTRPLAMGGAFISMQDDMAAINYNPAAFDLYVPERGKHITLFFNPVSAVVGAVENSDIYQGDGDFVDDVLLSLSLLLKSVALSWNSVDVAILLGEEGLDLPQTFLDEKLFGVSGFRQNHTHSFVGRLRLADKISIGASANLHYQSDGDEPMQRRSDVGINYGIWLRPEPGLQVGVSLINLPNSMRQSRMPLERFVDESVNVGISYELLNSRLSVDVRNIGEEQEMAVREVHIGFEQVVWSHVAIRAGWYKKKESEHVYSVGLGLADGNAFAGQNLSFGHRNFLFNYAFVYENNEIVDNRWHFLSFYLRL